MGTGGSDTLTGTPGDDVIAGLEGSDLIDGRGGNDRICGGDGSDTIEGSAGNDLINGDAGADTISGGGGNDRIFGGLGRDRLEGDDGNDSLFGEEGADEMDGEGGFDNCFVESRLDDARGCETNNPPNLPPTDILLANATVAENQPSGTTVGALSAVDPDVGDTHSFTLVAGAGDAGNASFQISGANLQTSTPLDFEAQSNFSVRIRASDAGGLFFDKAFTITVTDANDPPVGVNDSATVGEDSGANAIDVLANDSDSDGGPMSVASVTQPSNGSVSITGGGAGLSYTPNPNYCNSSTTDDTFTYTLNGGSTATVSVGVTCADDPPVAGNDSTTVGEDSGANAVDVLANDTDVDGGAKAVASVTQPANGTVAITGGGTGVTYTPGSDYCNSSTTEDTFNYTLNGGSSGTVSVTVTCADDPPTAVNDSATVGEDSGANAVDVMANDTDVDGGAKAVASVTQPANGTVAITGGGTGVTYTPNADYCNAPPGTSPDTFNYTMNGGSTATVSVAVTCADDPPTAVNDSTTVGEDSGANAVDVMANDTDIDGGAKAVASVTQPANGTVAITGGGSGVTYTPNPDYCDASPDTFTYTLNGGSGATVSVTVTCADDNATAVDDSATVGEDSAANAVDVMANDTDPDGGAKTVASVTQPANGTVEIAGGGTGVTYTPNANYCNAPPGTSPDTFTYSLNAGSTATVSVTVTCSDDLPVAAGDSATVAEDSGANAVDVLANDTDIDGGAKAVASVTQPSNGTVAITGGGTGLTYTPNAGYCNSSTTDDTFTYTLNGGSSATVSVQVTCVDDFPTAVNDSATVEEDSGVNAVDVLANDTDSDGGPKSVGSVTQPANGSVAITGGGTGVAYAPNANYCNDPPGDSPDTFTYTLNGGSSGTVSVTVTCAPDSPIVDTSAGSLAYSENDPATPIDDGVTVTHPDAGATITGATVAITTNFTTGQDVLALSGVHSGISGSLAGNTLTLSGTASPAAYQAALRAVTYSNTSEGPSTLDRTVTFTVTDGASLSGSDTRGITVTGVNDPPAAVNDTGTTDEDTPLTPSAPGVLANDTDIDPGDTKTVVALNGSGTLTGSSAEGGSVTINANGSYTYTPPAAFQALSTGQSDTDSFQYTMADAAGAQSTGTVNLTVDGVSDAPTAAPDSFDAIGNTGLFVGTVQPGGQAGRVVTGSVLANDTDPDTPQADLVVEAVTAGTTLGGTITIEADGNFTYQPDDGDTGVTDTFTYRVCDTSPCSSSTFANSTGTLSLPIAGQVWYVKNNSAAGGDGTSDGPFDTLVEAETASGSGDTVYIFDGDNTTSNLDTGYLMETDERLIGEHSVLSLDPAGPVPFTTLFAGTPGAHPTLTTTTAEDVVSLSSGGIVVGLNIDPGSGGGGIGGGAGAGGGAAGDVQIVNVNIVDTAPLGTQPGLELVATTGTTRISGLVVQNGGSATATGVRLSNAGAVLFDPATVISITTVGAKGLDAETTNLTGSGFDDITATGSSAGGLRMVTTTGAVALGDGLATDLSLTTTSGAAPAMLLNNVGPTTVAAAGTDEVSATGGPAVDIVNATGSTFSFDTVSSSDSASDGINLDGLGTSNFEATAGSIGGAAGITVDINGGSGNVTYPGALNNGAGQAAEVTARSGGAVTLSGNIADTSDPGGGIVVSGNTGGAILFTGTSKVINTNTGGLPHAVQLTNNPNTSIQFTGGGLDIDATTGRGLEATGGGSIVVQGSNNTINTGSGVPLEISGTTIGSNDVTFQSISANGATNGILLQNTGTSGGLTVQGTGPAGSGGTIQNIANRGASLINTREVSITDMNFTNANQNDGATPDGLPGGNGDENGAIHLSGATNVALTDINITNTAQHGINGVDVRNLDLTNVSITDAGNETPAAAGNLESGVYLTNLTGRASLGQDNVFNNLDVADTGSFNVYVANGTPSAAAPSEKDKLTITGSSFNSAGLNVLSDNITIDNFNTANFETVVTGSTFAAAVTCGTGSSTCSPDNIQVNANNSSNVKATIQTSTFTNAGQAGINVSASGAGQMAFDVLNNPTVSVRAATGINLSAAGSADLRGTVSGNTVATTVNNNPGFGIQAVADGAGTSIIANVANNNIGGTNPNLFDRGIRASARITGTIDLTLNNNNVFAKFEGAELESGNNTAGETARTCVNFVGNIINGQGSLDYFLSQYTGTTFQIQGLNVSGTSAPAVAGFIQATDAAAGDPTVDVNGGTTVNYTNATCATP